MAKQTTLPLMKEFMRVGTRLVCVKSHGYVDVGGGC